MSERLYYVLFGGDRMMTRYEFAQIVYRAMQNGAQVDE